MGVDVSAELGRINRVLLFGYMGMGDAVMFGPALTAILRRYPDAKVDAVVGKNSQSLVVLERVLSMAGRKFEHVIEIEFKALSANGLRRVNEQLAQAKYDLCIASYTTPVQFFLPAIISIPFRLGHTIRAQRWYKPRPNFIFNIPRPVVQAVDEREPYRHFRLAQAIGIQLQNSLPIPEIRTTPEEDAWATEYLMNLRLADKRLVAVHVGVSRAMAWKKWPDQRYAEVLSGIPDAHFLFFGSVDELPEIETARAQVQNRSTVVVGSFSLLQVAALLKRCVLLVSNDSGLGHLAIALGTKTLRIFGMSDRYGCEPYVGEHVTFYRDLTCSPCMNLGLIKPGYNLNTCGHRNCLNSITVQEINESAQRLLNTVP